MPFLMSGSKDQFPSYPDRRLADMMERWHSKRATHLRSARAAWTGRLIRTDSFRRGEAYLHRIRPSRTFRRFLRNTLAWCRVLLVREFRAVTYHFPAR